jgi:hypothetical protein
MLSTLTFMKYSKGFPISYTFGKIILNYFGGKSTHMREEFFFSQEYSLFNIYLFIFIALRPLKQSNSVSYDVPLTNANQRAMSVDGNVDTKRNTTPPITADGSSNNTWNSTGISASSSEHDNQETNAWSSDYSNSEDEYTILEENAVPVS